MAAADAANKARLDREKARADALAKREADRLARMKQLKTERAQRAEATVAKRASDADTNINVRPDAPPADDNFIYYYSWIGGATTGEWKLYRAPNTPENVAKYGSRAIGGDTQAEGGSSLGANALTSQPKPIIDSVGNIIGWTNGTKSTGGTGGTGGAGGSGTGGGNGGNNVSGSGISGTSAAANFAAQQAATAAAEAKKTAGQSAYNLLFEQFDRYGLGSLVEPLKQFIVDGLSQAEFTLRLRDTDAYKKRFAANQARIQKGLRALTEAEYINLEDNYQDVMRRYGLPESYYTRGDMGKQEGFEKFIAGDVSPVELEDRISTAQRRVINAAPEVSAALRQYYPEIGQGDMLAYFLDPEKAIENIKRKVTAAEIGGAATMAGLATGLTRAEELARYGVTGEQARQGFQTIAEVAPRGSQLADIYKQTPYTQTTAEQEVFGLAGATEAARQRKKLTQLEQASFGGSSGTTSGALGRDRAGAI